MSDKAIEIGDFWITKKNPIECEVTGLSLKREVPIITSYSAEDDCTDSCTQYEFLRDYEFLRKGSDSESDKDWVCSGCDKPISDCLCLVDDDDDVDMVNHPPHYKDASGIKCIEVTKHMQFCGGSCFKYLYRCGKKHDDIEDLKKAVKYTEWSCEIREKVSRYPSELIEKISMHREGHIKKAMEYVSQGCWALAGNAIKAEIARLESEQ